MRSVMVTRGEHIAQLAFKCGVSVDAVWNLPENRALHASGRQPNMLCVGDVVYLPPSQSRSFKLRAGQAHSFSAKIPKQRTSIRIVVEGKPITDAPCEISGISGSALPSRTDKNGWLEIDVPVTCHRVLVHVLELGLRLSLNVGFLEPVETPNGVRMRLILLGLFFGAERGRIDAEIKAILRSFQASHALTVNGEADTATRARLVEVVGC